MEAPLKVAYVVVMFPCYSETFVLRELRELSRRGAEVTILSLRAFSEKIIDEDARALLPRTCYSPYLLSLGLVRSNLRFAAARPRAYFGTLALLVARLMRGPRELLKHLALFPKTAHFARLLEERGVRHVHAHFVNYPASAAYIIRRLTGIPFSMTAHAHDIFQSRLLLQEKLAAAEKVFAISEYNRRFILAHCPGAPPEKIEVLHCGLDLSSIPPRRGGGDDPHVVLAVGRLMAIKGFDTLVKAMGILRGRRVRVRCVIVGEGPERAALEGLIDRLSLRETVAMEGERTPAEVLSYMGRCGIFALPSRPAGRKSGVMDGIPVSLMEAMAMGIPVVSCSVSGIPELVENGRTGLLVPPGDERALADAIGRMLVEKGVAAKLAEEGREKVRRDFSIERSVDRLVEVFARSPVPIPKSQ